jgi:hypothetical protein
VRKAEARLCRACTRVSYPQKRMARKGTWCNAPKWGAIGRIVLPAPRTRPPWSLSPKRPVCEDEESSLTKQSRDLSPGPTPTVPSRLPRFLRTPPAHACSAQIRAASPRQTIGRSALLCSATRPPFLSFRCRRPHNIRDFGAQSHGPPTRSLRLAAHGRAQCCTGA